MVNARSVSGPVVRVVLADDQELVRSGQWAALIRFSADVPVSIPWLSISAITAGCATVAMLASLLPAWLLLRARIVELADLRE